MSMSSEMLILSADQVSSALEVKPMVEALEKAFGNFSKGPEGGVVQPVRSVVAIPKPKGSPEQSGFFGVMPVYSACDDALACKLLSFYPGNATSGKPTHSAKILLYDPAYGELKAIMDGDVITAMRTAGASAVATKYLYSGSVESPVKVAILGAGVQARSHAKVLREIFTISELNIWSRTMTSAISCADDVNGTACLSVAEAVDGADIIVTATSSELPILKKEWVKPGAHINAVGACRPDWHELDPELVRNSVVYVDSREAAAKEAGDIILASADIYAEIGEIINGAKECKTEPITIFKSLGMGLEDAVSAKLVYDLYIKRQPST